MAEMRIVHLRNLDEFRSASSAWDDLWRRSETTFPTVQAALVEQWVKHFTAESSFQVIAVEEDGRWTAALPLVFQKVARYFRGGTLPCNEWSSSGDLLFDPRASESTLKKLMEAISRLPISLLWLDEVFPETTRWKTFGLAGEQLGFSTVFRPRWKVGRVVIGSDWQGYQSSWSRKHRQATARHLRQLSHFGDVRLRLESHFAPGEAEKILRSGLEIEDRGWKGTAGSSILKTPGMESFFLGQAELLAERGQLEVAFLELGGRPIAFSYGLTAKGVYHSEKIGYDPAFAEYSPGQLLRYFLLERFFHEPGRKALDFLGPITESHTAWRPEEYSVARQATSLGRKMAQLAVAAYRHW